METLPASDRVRYTLTPGARKEVPAAAGAESGKSRGGEREKVEAAGVAKKKGKRGTVVEVDRQPYLL